MSIPGNYACVAHGGLAHFVPCGDGDSYESFGYIGKVILFVAADCHEGGC